MLQDRVRYGYVLKTGSRTITGTGYPLARAETNRSVWCADERVFRATSEDTPRGPRRFEASVRGAWQEERVSLWKKRLEFCVGDVGELLLV